MSMTRDEKCHLIDLVRCVKLIAWHVQYLQQGEAKIELEGVLDNLAVIQRVIQATLA